MNLLETKPWVQITYTSNIELFHLSYPIGSCGILYKHNGFIEFSFQKYEPFWLPAWSFLHALLRKHFFDDGLINPRLSGNTLNFDEQEYFDGDQSLNSSHTSVNLFIFLVETNIMNMIDSHQDQQLESDLNIKDQFRNVLFPGKIWKRTEFNTLPEPARALWSNHRPGIRPVVDHLGLARSATQQLKDRFRNLIRLGRHRRTGSK